MKRSYIRPEIQVFGAHVECQAGLTDSMGVTSTYDAKQGGEFIDDNEQPDCTSRWDNSWDDDNC